MKTTKIFLSLSLALLMGGCSKKTSNPTILKIEPCHCYNDASSYLGLCFDDLNIAHLKIAKLLDEYGLKGSFYVNTKNIRDGHILVYKRILQSGHEVGNHTVNHVDLTSLSTLEMEREISEAKSALEEKLNIKCLTLSTPYAKVNNEVVSYALKSGMFTRQAFYNYGRFKFGLYSKTKIEDVREYINKQINIRQNFITGGHGIDNQGWEPSSSSFFRELFEYINEIKKTKNICVAPIRDICLYSSLYENTRIIQRFDNENGIVDLGFSYESMPIYDRFDNLYFTFRLYKNNDYSVKLINNDHVLMKEFSDYYLFTIDLKQRNKCKFKIQSV